MIIFFESIKKSIALLALCCCFSTQILSADSRPKIVTTTGMIADIVSAISGEHVSVQSLMGSGVDPHLYRPTSGDIKKLVAADVIFFNGLHLEGRMQEIFKKMSRSRPIYAVADQIDSDLLIQVDEHTVDPHIWMDVALWLKAAEGVSHLLVKHWPEFADQFQSNYTAYRSKMLSVHEEIKHLISSIPERSRVLVTAHDAFAYFGRSYEIQVIGLQGISTADEFGLSDMLHVQKVVAEYQVKSVFFESSVTHKFITSLRKGLEKKNVHVAIGGELFSDAMGVAGTVEGTYLGMMLHNAKTIQKGLR